MKNYAKITVCVTAVLLGLILVSCKSSKNNDAKTEATPPPNSYRTVKIVYLSCRQNKPEPLKKKVWIEAPEGKVTPSMVQNGIRYYQLEASPSREQADYIMTAKIGVLNNYGRRSAISFVVTLFKNVPAKDIVWMGTASCSASSKYNMYDFTPSMFACIMTQFNRTYNGQFGFSSAQLLYSVILGTGVNP